MNIDALLRNLRVLWRADRIVAEIRLRRMLVSFAAGSFAALFAAFGVLMLELAAYFALVQIWTAIAAAVLLGAINFALGGVILLIASRKGQDSAELETAQALHSSAIEALQAQARTFDAARPSQSALETILPSVIVPAIGMLVKSLRQRKAQAAE
jgi:hypothetical protein